MVTLSHSQRFAQLNLLLDEYRDIWDHSAFQHHTLCWQDTRPELYRALITLDDRQLCHLESSAAGLHTFIGNYLPGYEAFSPLITLPNEQQNLSYGRFLDVGIPGRKWQQVIAFLAASDIQSVSPETELVDWCAGKSHLGRTAAILTGASLLAIEHEPVLCQAGLVLAEKHGVDARYECVDVLTSDFDFHAQHQVMALHACGDLHRRLLVNWKNSDSRQLRLSPCCYEKWLQGDYQPLSSNASENGIRLTKDNVRLAMQETVTASKREQAMQHQLQIARLTFDLMQRDVRAIDEYLPTPSLPLSAANWPLKKVLQVFADKQNLSLPEDIQVAEYQQRATARYQQIRRLQLAAQGFRRALELWLVCDLALFLEEDGAEVSLKTFCDRDLSPRNIQLLARKSYTPG